MFLLFSENEYQFVSRNTKKQLQQKLERALLYLRPVIGSEP
jgi:hypothetical protein